MQCRGLVTREGRRLARCSQGRAEDFLFCAHDFCIYDIGEANAVAADAVGAVASDPAVGIVMIPLTTGFVRAHSTLKCPGGHSSGFTRM